MATLAEVYYVEPRNLANNLKERKRAYVDLILIGGSQMFLPYMPIKKKKLIKLPLKQKLER